ncbi:MAG: phospholipase D family protein [Planctomycetota bacterium]
METLLLPNDGKKLRQVYERAFHRADELFILTAFLTDWGFKKGILNPRCKRIEIYFGTDFSLSRKQAIRDLLHWLPSKHKTSLFEVRSSMTFHPKMLLWREGSSWFTLVGSSNLTTSGMSGNIEANEWRCLGAAEAIKIKRWIQETSACYRRAVNEKWISLYRERPFVGKKRRQDLFETKGRIANLKLLPRLSAGDIAERREQIRYFRSHVEKPLKVLILRCARNSGRAGSQQFYEQMWDAFWGTKCRIQGNGMQILGKSANWREACQSLTRIFAAGDENRDDVVRDEVDFLKKNKNVVRKAWLSEVLSRYYPTEYPLLAGPAWRWLAASHYSKPRGASEGATYLDIARKYRAYTARDKRYRNLLELDCAIWKKYPKR